jgi:hypothetical protein
MSFLAKTEKLCACNPFVRLYVVEKSLRCIERFRIKQLRDRTSITKAVFETLSRQLDAVKILDVKLNEDIGPEGEDVLRIEVIYEGDPGKIDPRIVSGMIRVLRPILNDAHESGFPLISLISKADLPRERRAS